MTIGRALPFHRCAHRRTTPRISSSDIGPSTRWIGSFRSAASASASRCATPSSKASTWSLSVSNSSASVRLPRHIRARVASSVRLISAEITTTPTRSPLCHVPATAIASCSASVVLPPPVSAPTTRSRPSRSPPNRLLRESHPGIAMPRAVASPRRTRLTCSIARVTASAISHPPSSEVASSRCPSIAARARSTNSVGAPRYVRASADRSAATSPIRRWCAIARRSATAADSDPAGGCERILSIPVSRPTRSHSVAASPGPSTCSVRASSSRLIECSDTACPAARSRRIAPITARCSGTHRSSTASPRAQTSSAAAASNSASATTAASSSGSKRSGRPAMSIAMYRGFSRSRLTSHPRSPESPLARPWGSGRPATRPERLRRA